MLSAATEDNGRENPVTAKAGGSAVLDAARAYAANDIPVVVFDATVGNGKQCGNLVGNSSDDTDKWYDHASTDPDLIREWLRQFGPRATGIATSPGKADALVADVDRPELVPAEWWPHLNSAPMQSTDATDPLRGHYWFDRPPGERLGNMSFPWGEIRCDGGGVILSPTRHVRAASGGRYVWVRQGETAPLPDVIAAALRAKAGDHQGRGVAMTDAEIDAWLSDHNGDDFPRYLLGVHNRFYRLVNEGAKKRHDAMHDVLTLAMCEVAASAYPGWRAHDELLDSWTTALRSGTDHERPFDAREWRGMVGWAINQADADDGQTRRRRMSREYGTRHDDPINTSRDHKATDTDSANADEVAAFWSSSPQLSDLRQFAQARLVGPWAMLGTTLARAVSHIPGGEVKCFPRREKVRRGPRKR